ncbi:MAG: DDE-type integrase/transposase/recombinase [Porphyrobacter sp.]|nr:DDE-type integrase/transposase/recombinase [Porphyrobacter sp.]
MTYIDFRADTMLQYRNANWSYERRQGSRTEWRSTTSFEHLPFTDREIQGLIREGKLKVLCPRVVQKGEPAKVSKIHGERDYSEADWEEAHRKLLWVQAARKRRNSGKKLKSEDWLAAINEVWDKFGVNWNVLRGKRKGFPENRKPSIKSMQRWDVAAGVPPKAANLLNEHRRKGNFEDKVDAGVRELLNQMIKDEWMCRPAISMEVFKGKVAARINRRNKAERENGNPWNAPGEAAIQSSIDLFPAEEVLRSRYGDMAAHLAYGSGEAQEDPKAPLDRVELDSTPADLFVLDPVNGFPLGRPHIVVAIDRCTRMVLGWFVTFERPSVHALMQTLRNAILSKDYVDEMNTEHGWNIRHPCETYGVMRELALDRALENLAGHVAALAVKAGINRVVIMKRKAPWLKGCVERVIRTMSEQLLHPVRGTTLHNTLKLMDYNPAKDAVCTIDDLDHGLHKFFIDIYPREVRRSLNNARAIDLWRNLTKEYPVTSIDDVRSLDHFFGLTDKAAVRRSGISAHNMQYTSQELQRHFKTPKFRNAIRKADDKITYHLDPGDIGTIYVRLPHRPETITVPVAPKWRQYAKGLSLFHHKLIRRYTKSRALDANDADELMECRAELYDIMRGQAFGKRGAIRAAQTLARIEGIARYARSGDDVSTTAPGSDAHNRKGSRQTSSQPSNDTDTEIVANFAVQPIEPGTIWTDTSTDAQHVAPRIHRGYLIPQQSPDTDPHPAVETTDLIRRQGYMRPRQ